VAFGQKSRVRFAIDDLRAGVIAGVVTNLRLGIRSASGLIERLGNVGGE
jgi:hypothetical protein